MKVDFFILGAPRCGTTALSRYLEEHPQVCMSRPKEPNYFCEDLPGLRVAHDEVEYARCFTHCVPYRRMRIGEASVWYLFSAVAVSRILETAPDARLVVMVRNPIDMLQSLHAKYLENLEEDVPDLRDAWHLQDRRSNGQALPPFSKEPRRLQYESVCKLGEQVTRLLRQVPSHRVKVIVFDDLVADAAAVYADVLSHLGLPHDGRTEFPLINANARLRSPRFARWLRDPPGPVRPMVRALGRVEPARLALVALRELARDLNRKPARRGQLPPRFRSELIEAFRDDVALLGEQISRDLNHWMTPSDHG